MLGCCNARKKVCNGIVAFSRQTHLNFICDELRKCDRLGLVKVGGGLGWIPKRYRLRVKVTFPLPMSQLEDDGANTTEAVKARLNFKATNQSAMYLAKYCTSLRDKGFLCGYQGFLGPIRAFIFISFRTKHTRL